MLSFLGSGVAVYACTQLYALVTVSGWVAVGPLRNCVQTRTVILNTCGGPGNQTDCVFNKTVYLSQDGLWNGVSCVEWENTIGVTTTVYQSVGCSPS